MGVSLVLGGRALDLVQSGSDWVARRDAPDIRARVQGDSWVVFDGQGRTYSFTLHATPGNPAASMWLLKSITGVGGSRVELDYSITTPTVPGGGGLAIDLTNVSYNPHPTTANCFKNSVALVYDADVAAPLSLSVLGEHILVRNHKLVTVNVKSKATCGDAYVRLRAYQLDYTQDVDTHQPRLSSVKVVGREGSPEAATPIPLGMYSYGTYGTATTNGMLKYQFAEQVPDIASKQPYTVNDTLTNYVAGRSLVDMTGDGLPDVVAFAKNQSPKLVGLVDWMHSLSAYTFSDAVLPDSAIESMSMQHVRYGRDPNVDRVWRQAIDVNGDGRIDIIDASAEPGKWVVYLNVPGDPRFVQWVKRSYSTQSLGAYLVSRGFAIDANHVPLSQRTTARQYTTRTCWKWENGHWTNTPVGFQLGMCTVPTVIDGLETTFTEWEVRDVNGDGYPDVVFNSSPAAYPTNVPGSPIGPPDPEMGPWLTIESSTALTLPSWNEIDAMLNVLGVHFDVNDQPFSPPVLLRANDPCGVARWSPSDDSHQELSCSVIDVNGDGVADRVTNQSVFLGTGTFGGTGFFTPSAMLTLPGALATQINEQATKCAPPATGNTQFTTSQTAGLRDLTGDGIPDYFTATGTGAGSVQIGTGSGFLGPIAIDGMFMTLSSQVEDCNGFRSTTTAGLFDVDGDGKPEVLTTDGSVYKVVSNGALGAPQAGRLVRVDNGFGAATIITFRSAKLLAVSGAVNGLHQVPFPEVVVSSVETTKTQSPGTTLLAKTQYAYGGAQLVFDAALDAFRFPGYRRHVALRIPTEQSEGLATLTDAYGPDNTADPFGLASGTLTADQRYARLLRHGRVSDVTVLSGSLGTDPSALLSVNVATDAHRIANTHYEYDAKVLPAASTTAEACIEMVYPYNYATSKPVSDNDHIDACRQRGFAFAASVQSLRSNPGAVTSFSTVATRSEVRTIDDFGRPTSVKQLGDTASTDDDVCVDTEYAAPKNGVLWAVSRRTVKDGTGTDCGTTIYARDTFQYDEAGLPTSHSVERHDDTGAPKGEVRAFDASFTPEGNPGAMTTKREDGATRTASVTYDAFGLVPVVITTTASGLPELKIDLTRDPLTLNVIKATDPNLTRYGTTFDGFDRPMISTVTPPGGTEGALSCTIYQGFGGGDSQGRRVTSKVFTDVVLPATACAATGRTATVYLDEVGRPRLTEQVLGADYPNVTMKADRTYDSLGRLLFATDPYPSNQDAATAYGITRYFNGDGTPSCFIRGKGKQPRPSVIPMATDETNEVYPTCFSHNFQGSTEPIGAGQDWIQYRRWIGASAVDVDRV